MSCDACNAEGPLFPITGTLIFCKTCLDNWRRKTPDGGSPCCHQHKNPNNIIVRMIVCKKCGNKRCPKATDCSLECTKSNEPGQKGSIWENYRL